MATQEVEFITTTARDDNHRGGTLLNNNRSEWDSLRVGPGVKEVGDQDAYIRHALNIPQGSIALRAKTTGVVQAGPGEHYPEENLPLLRLGFLEPDGWWDHIGFQSSYQNQLHLISQVRDTVNALIFTTSISAYGPDVGFRTSGAGGANYTVCGSFGMKFKASETKTLGNIIARVWRDDDPETKDVYCRVYSPISASDPRPGVLRATSDPLPYNDLPIVAPGGTPPTDWPEWTFSGDQQIELTNSQEYVYTIEGIFTGTHKMYWRTDDDRGGTPEVRQWNLPVTDVWAVWNEVSLYAFSFGFYVADDLMPEELFEGTGYTDDFKPAEKDLYDDDVVVWGNADYNPDVEIDLKALIQAFIDDPRYDESGTMLGVFVACADPDVGGELFFNPQHWAAGKDGFVLTVAYTEPVPSKAANPDPPHLATDVWMNADLSWDAATYAGTGAVTYKVYFGTDSDPSGNYIGEQPGTTYDPGQLVAGQTYYWRIDSVGEFETTAGDVWQFTTTADILGPFFDAETRVRSALMKKAGKILPAVRGQLSVVPVKLAAELDLRPAVEAKIRVELIADTGAGAGARLGADTRVRACAKKDCGRIRPALEGSTRMVPVKLVAELRALPAVSGREVVAPAVSGDLRIRGGKYPKGRGES